MDPTLFYNFLFEISLLVRSSEIVCMDEARTACMFFLDVTFFFITVLIYGSEYQWAKMEHVCDCFMSKHYFMF